MDDLTASFAGSVSVSTDPCNVAAAHPRFSQYKVKTNHASQENRREERLRLQKKRRDALVNRARQLIDEECEMEEKEETEKMDCSVQRKKYFYNERQYANVLMLSEWLVDVPSDLNEEWLVVPCPIGKRSLVVASKGTTRSFTKAGLCVNTFPSALPGGNRTNKLQKPTLLDCIWSDLERSFYVLDILCWKGHSLVDCDTEFRFTWGLSNLHDQPSVSERSRLNPNPFRPAGSHSCAQVEDVLRDAAVKGHGVDGLLFYHKRTSYVSGPTPLVGWLKPYMVPELLGVPVDPQYMNEAPADYVNAGEHVKNWNESQEKKRGKKGEKMDLATDKS